MAENEQSVNRYVAFVQGVLEKGMTGAGPFKSAEQVAEEALKHSKDDREKAIKRIIKNHTTTVSATGFVTGIGGFSTMVVGVPADVTAFYVNATRMVAAVALLRDYDIHSEEVRTAITISLIGAFGTENLAKAGINIANKAAIAALKKVPGRVVININKKVGFRLLTKFGEKGAINLVKVVPFIGGGVGAGVNAVSMRAIAGYALSNFPVFDNSQDSDADDIEIIVDELEEAEIIDE